MPWIVVHVPPYDGEYEFDQEASPLTHKEWRWVKKISGYLPLTADVGFQGGDPDLFLSWAVIAMVRAGKITADEVYDVVEVLEVTPFDGTAITVKGDTEQEAEEDPLVSAAPPSSGDATVESSEPSPENGSPPATGSRGSDTISDYARRT